MLFFRWKAGGVEGGGGVDLELRNVTATLTVTLKTKIPGGGVIEEILLGPGLLCFALFIWCLQPASAMLLVGLFDMTFRFGVLNGSLET